MTDLCDARKTKGPGKMGDRHAVEFGEGVQITQLKAQSYFENLQSWNSCGLSAKTCV